MNSILKLLKNLPVEEMTKMHSEIREAVFPYLGDPSHEIRATVFRVYRHLLISSLPAEELWRHHLAFFINRLVFNHMLPFHHLRHSIRALARDTKYESEREQAIKLVRGFVDQPELAKTIPDTVIKSIIAVAEHVEDKLRNISIETLCELGTKLTFSIKRVNFKIATAVRNFELVELCGGSKVILQVLVDGPSTLIEVVVPTLVYLVDSPITRKLIRPEVDIEVRNIT